MTEKLEKLKTKIVHDLFESFKLKQSHTKKKLILGHRGELLHIHDDPISFSIGLEYAVSGKSYRDHLSSYRVDEKVHKEFMKELGKMNDITQYQELEDIRLKLRKKIETL